MILGLNTNHEYNGKVYHVQTEDSGVDHPMITTHCFIGGTIIKSRQTDYADAVDRDDLASYLRGIAREQHRSMVTALLGGEFQKEILSASRGGSTRTDVPLASDKKNRSFKPGQRANKLPGKGPPSLGPTKAVNPKRPPPLPANAKGKGKGKGKDEAEARRTQSFSDTQLMDVDESDLLEELPAEDAAFDAGGPLQFPSRLLRPEPLDPVTLAYLLEDEPTR